MAAFFKEFLAQGEWYIDPQRGLQRSEAGVAASQNNVCLCGLWCREGGGARVCGMAPAALPPGRSLAPEAPRWQQRRHHRRRNTPPPLPTQGLGPRPWPEAFFTSPAAVKDCLSGRFAERLTVSQLK